MWMYVIWRWVYMVCICLICIWLICFVFSEHIVSMYVKESWGDMI